MSETWDSQTWGDLATLEYGKGLREYDDTEPVYPVFGTNGQIGWHSSPLWNEAGIVIGRKGAYRGVHYSSRPFFVIDTAFYLKPKTDFDLKWAYYQLKDVDINKIDSGSAIPSTSREAFYAIPVIVPPLPVQHKIAAVLSAYDDLIENNTRRIRILEEMAQTLYREWFVHFRFPGHEKCRMVKSEVGPIPEGWQAVAATVPIDFNPQTRLEKGGYKPFVPMGSLSETSMLIQDIETRTGNSGAKFKNGDTLFARITPCLENGKTAFVQFLPTEKDAAFGSTEFIVMRSRSLCPEFVYLLARSSEFRDNAIKCMSGATGRQRVQEAAFSRFMIAHPDEQTIQNFSATVRPMFGSINNLSMRNMCLRQTRDLLLPKLISGELDVADLDITTGTGGAA